MPLEEALKTRGTLTHGCRGVSMRPMLRGGRDYFTVRAKDGQRCRRGDVVLYRRPPGEYVLHRIIKVRPDGYVILGDNCEQLEPGIRDEDVLGVLTDFVRKDRAHRVTDPGYKLYAFLWLHTASLRIIIKKTYSRCKRALRRLARNGGKR